MPNINPVQLVGFVQSGGDISPLKFAFEAAMKVQEGFFKPLNFGKTDLIPVKGMTVEQASKFFADKTKEATIRTHASIIRAAAIAAQVTGWATISKNIESFPRTISQG